MWNVVQFPRTRVRDRMSGVRVVYVTDHWCVERLEAGDIIARSRMPSRSDAERIAARICRRDKLMMLTARRSRPRPWPSFHQHTPDDAA